MFHVNALRGCEFVASKGGELGQNPLCPNYAPPIPTPSSKRLHNSHSKQTFCGAHPSDGPKILHSFPNILVLGAERPTNTATPNLFHFGSLFCRFLLIFYAAHGTMETNRTFHWFEIISLLIRFSKIVKLKRFTEPNLNSPQFVLKVYKR